MPRHRSEPPIPHHIVPALIRYVRTRGGNADHLIGRFSLHADVEAQPEAKLTMVQFGSLLAAAADELDEPFLALSLPEQLTPRRYTLAELASGASPTHRAALERIVHYAALIHPQIAFSLEERGREAIWTQRVVGHPRGVGRHANEYALASLLSHARKRCGTAFHPERVWFVHERPRDVGPLQNFFGTRRIEFERADNGLVFERALLDEPVLGCDPRMLETIDRLAREALVDAPPVSDFVGRVEAHLRDRMSNGFPRAEKIARELHMSSRTLQRRLEEAGTSFKDLLVRVRSELARRHMSEGKLSIAEVTCRLGFSDVSTFGRAFKRWTGKSPKAYRRSGSESPS
jgi:AraC-like DNA-binding protein